MDNKKDTLSYLVAKIKREAEYGEQAEACRKVGVTYHVLQKAMKRKKLVDLTTGELKAVNLFCLFHIAFLCIFDDS